MTETLRLKTEIAILGQALQNLNRNFRIETSSLG